MDFADKYISERENLEKPDAKKLVLSNDAYALGEILHQLSGQLQAVMEIMRIK